MLPRVPTALGPGGTAALRTPTQKQGGGTEGPARRSGLSTCYTREHSGAQSARSGSNSMSALERATVPLVGSLTQREMTGTKPSLEGQRGFVNCKKTTPRLANGGARGGWDAAGPGASPWSAPCRAPGTARPSPASRPGPAPARTRETWCRPSRTWGPRGEAG